MVFNALMIVTCQSHARCKAILYMACNVSPLDLLEISSTGTSEPGGWGGGL